MNIRQFEYILAVAEHKHFELAADKCFISQSTLSTMIAKFEEEQQVKIFNRKKKPLEVTAEGELIINQLKIIVKQIQTLTELTKEIKGEVSGKLSISVIPTIAPFLLPVFLHDFSLKFPQLHITVNEQTTEEIINKIKSRELDIGILSIPVKEKYLLETPLYNEPFLLYDIKKRNKKRIHPKDLDYTNMWLMEDGHCLRTQVIEICDMNEKNRKLQVNSNLHFSAGSIDSLLRFVKASGGKTLLPYLSTLDFTKKQKDCINYFEPPVPYRSIGLVVHEDFAKKKILNLIKEEIQTKISRILPKQKEPGRKIEPI